MDKYVGKRLDGRYEIQEIIGIGGMAVVYKAYDALNDRTVAIKILKDELLENQEFRRRFKNESKAIAVLSHPNIVKVYDVGLGDRIQYIVMEHIDGITLKEYIKSQQTIRWKDALYFAEQVLKALQHAHDKGIVHRDIKPQNIILLPDGTIKVTDFGIARFSRSEHRTLTDKAIGSVHYISPEQARGELTDEKTDLYSVGVLLYEMLTGKLPFDAESAVSVAIMQLQNDPVNPRKINPGIPEGLEEIILRAMQKNQDKRYQSAAEMLRDIDSFKLNPSIQFEYKYFVDSEPTKFVDVTGSDMSGNTRPGRSKTEEAVDGLVQPGEDEEEEKKSAAVPILIGVTVAVVLVVVFVGLYLLGSIFGIGPFKKDSQIANCPDFIGMVYNDVVVDEKYKGFTFTMGDSEYSEEYEAGEIMKQIPEAGKQLKGDKKEVVLTVSLGPKSNIMEDLTGWPLSTAETRLSRAGITFEAVEVYSDKQQAGYITETIPPKDSVITPGQSVTVYVSKGPRPRDVKVSDYEGLKDTVALKKIEGDGLTVGRIIREESTTYAAGLVIRQSITPGTDIASDTKIDLVVSSGKPVTINLPIPANATMSFTITAHHNGKKLVGGDVGLMPSDCIGGVYTFTISKGANTEYIKEDATTAEILIKYSGHNYKTYKVDFEKGTATEIKSESIPQSVLGVIAPPVVSVPNEQPSVSQPQSKPVEQPTVSQPSTESPQETPTVSVPEESPVVSAVESQPAQPTVSQPDQSQGGTPEDSVDDSFEEAPAE